MAREVKQWITIDGQHIPIFEGQSKQDVVNSFIAKKNEDTKEKQIAKNKAESDRLNGKKSPKETKIPREQLKKILKAHSIQFEESDDGSVVAYTEDKFKDTSEYNTDLTGFSMKKLRDWLGY